MEKNKPNGVYENFDTKVLCYYHFVDVCNKSVFS